MIESRRNTTVISHHNQVDWSGLAERIHAGDSDAEEQLCVEITRIWLPWACKVFRGQMLCGTSPDDIIQNAAMDCILALRRRIPDNPTHYVCRIVRRKWLRFWDNEADIVVASRSSCHDLRSLALNPEESLIHDQQEQITKEKLIRAIETLRRCPLVENRLGLKLLLEEGPPVWGKRQATYRKYGITASQYRNSRYRARMSLKILLSGKKFRPGVSRMKKNR